MASMTELKARLAFRQKALEKLQTAYLELLDGGAKSYTIDGRQLTKLDLPELEAQIIATEAAVDSLSAQVSGKKPRKAVGIMPMDW